MDKLPAINSIVTFSGYAKKTDNMSTDYTGKVIGYGTVSGGLWEDEPEAVCLVDVEGDGTACIMAVSHKGMQLVKLPV